MITERLHLGLVKCGGLPGHRIELNDRSIEMYHVLLVEFPASSVIPSQEIVS